MLLAGQGPCFHSPVDLRRSHALRLPHCLLRRRAASCHLPYAAFWDWQSLNGQSFGWVVGRDLHQTPFGAWQLAFRNGHVALDLWCSSPHRYWHSWCMSVRHYRFHMGNRDSFVSRTSCCELNMARGEWRDGVGRESETDAADVQLPLCLRQGRSPTRQHQKVPRKPPRLLISGVKRERGCGARAVPCRTGVKWTGGTRRVMWGRKRE